jgi:hypothetical protein
MAEQQSDRTCAEAVVADQLERKGDGSSFWLCCARWPSPKASASMVLCLEADSDAEGIAASASQVRVSLQLARTPSPYSRHLPMQRRPDIPTRAMHAAFTEAELNISDQFYTK